MQKTKLKNKFNKKKIYTMEIGIILDILITGIPEEVLIPVIFLSTGFLSLIILDPTRLLLDLANEAVFDYAGVALFHAFA
jgi:hypothetical protein